MYLLKHTMDVLGQEYSVYRMLTRFINLLKNTIDGFGR